MRKSCGRGGVLQSIQTIRKTALFQFETGLTPSVGIACGKHAVTHFKYIYPQIPVGP
jgi:hypothetical protein